MSTKRPFLIGIAGGTCCGKTEICKKICSELNTDDANNGRIIILAFKNFYKDELSAEDKLLAVAGNYDFDHPDAFDEELIIKTLTKLKKGEAAEIPEYDYNTHARLEEKHIIGPADVILFEGILVLYHKTVRDLLDLKIFVDTDCDTRLARRVLRDTTDYKRDIDNVLSQYLNFVKRSFEDFTMPTKRYADLIIPRGVDNKVAIELIVQHIRDMNSSVRKAKRRTVSESNAERPH